MEREASIAGLASEGLARISGSAGTGSIAVVGPTPADPVEFRKCARDLKALSAAKEHTNEERGGGRDPGVRNWRRSRSVASTLEDLSCRNALSLFNSGFLETGQPNRGEGSATARVLVLMLPRDTRN